ncbi:response regulator [Aspergillus mulundensis]|uniref:Response regulatory domain-containing protein n=1 Tax=Aspergillus mulundensis TaxID=1810919 RepID=A0A3D8T4G5_9EURO|nr:Uncharacterized protein DSM5745_00768 [Aspergillus mulundensis]RDW93446.1 Uncharacterized protein DSM5745_00768 [Aspergillus mulundensis]
MHILVAEDNAVIQKLLLRFLHRLGCTVAFANNGQEALDYLSASPTTHPRPSIILMDTAMPVMGGIEATNILRTQAPFTKDHNITTTPIIAMTAHIYRPQIDGGLWRERGFDDVLLKPPRPAKLRQMILYWSRRRVMPRHGDLAVPRTGNMVPLSPAGAPWGPSPLRAFKGPRSLL